MATIVWSKNRGRNGWDHPLEVGLDASVESLNISLYNGGLGTKRGGSTAVVFAGQQVVNAAIEYIPGQDQTLAELFLVDGATPPAILRSVSGTSTSFTVTSLTPRDDIASSPQFVSGAVINGKLFLAYDSTVNRLHVFDPNTSTSAVRRTGFVDLAGFGASPTVANTGAGAYPATLRYYKIAYTEKQSGVVMRRSELSNAAGFTPSGTGTAARITKPPAINESETHWEVYGSTDDTTYYGPILSTDVGTTTLDDTTTPSDWADDFDAAPVVGQNMPWPSVKSLATDGKRLLGMGVWETSTSLGQGLTPKNGRVYFSRVLDSTDIHDEEVVSNTTENEGFIDLARNSGAVDVGLAPRPVDNVVYAFQSVGVYGLYPTESPTTPYRRVVMSSERGALTVQSIVMGQDRLGRSCAYFLDPTLGPHTIGGPDGLRWCGKDVKDVWDTVNQDATTLVACGCWYPDRNLVLFAVATGDSNEPDTILALDVTEQTLDEVGDLRGGWTIWTGDFASARSMVVFSNTGATPRSRVRVPHVGLNSAATLLRYDESATFDGTAVFQGSVTSGVLAQDDHDLEVRRAYLAASAETGTSIEARLVRNFGDASDRASTVSLAPENDETAVLRKFEDAALQDAWAVQVTLGDSTAVPSQWQLHQYRVDLAMGAER